MGEAGRLISEWEGLVTAMTTKHGEELSPAMKKAVLMGMLDDELFTALLQRGAVREKMP